MSETESLRDALALADVRSLRTFAEEARRVDGDAIGPMFYRDVVRLCDSYEAVLESWLAPNDCDVYREPSCEELKGEELR